MSNDRSLNPNLMHSDHFHFAADKRLFAFLRKRENRKYLERHRLRFYFGRGGSIQFVPAQPCRMSPHRRERKWITVSTLAFDTGRVYVRFQNFRGRIAENFESLLPLVVEHYEQVERGAPAEPMFLLSTMPEVKQPRTPTKFYAVVMEHRREREQRRRARQQEQS